MVTAKSRIKVFNFEHEGRKVPYPCTQCAEAWCLNACSVDAIRLDQATDAKVVETGTCVRCKVNGKVQKCNLCGGDPACVAACPTGAITYVDADWAGLERMASWAKKTAAAVLAQEGGYHGIRQSDSAC